jgi:hypothetical protein
MIKPLRGKKYIKTKKAIRQDYRGEGVKGSRGQGFKGLLQEKRF